MAISIITDISSWDDEDFKKNRLSAKGYYDNIRSHIAAQDPKIAVCVWCGKKFLKKHHSEKYCCDECRNDARGQQSRNKAHRWYHKNKHRLSEKQRWGLGSGTLGQHMHEDFEKEQSVIEKEFTRLKIKRLQ